MRQRGRETLQGKLINQTGFASYTTPLTVAYGDSDSWSKNNCIACGYNVDIKLFLQFMRLVVFIHSDWDHLH